jgi:hypothetical protein
MYEQNLRFFKKSVPSFYNIINSVSLDDIEIRIDDNNINIYKNGISLIPHPSSDYLAKKIEQFINNPDAFCKKPTKTKAEDISIVSDSFVMKIENNIPEQEQDCNSYSKHLDSISVLVMFGIATAQQIEQLIDIVDIKTLIVVDEDYTMLKASMHIVNWEKIIRYFSQPGYTIDFKIGKNKQNLSIDILDEIFKYYLYSSYYIPYFVTYDNLFFKDILKIINENYMQIFAGWGFYDDEILSLKHTIDNIKAKIPILKNIENKDIYNKAEVFIVASGPSVDKDIEYIKKYKDKVLILSCGTALKIFEKHNIVPDYHFEIERTQVTYTQIYDNISKEFLEKVKFIGLNVLQKNVFELFKDSKMFFRDNDTGSSLLDNNIFQFQNCNPTVVNAVLSFVSTLGFGNIYLFGADMGYKDEKVHHSKDTIYQKKGTKCYRWKPDTIQQKLKANFNDNDIYTTAIFSWCKKRAEDCMLQNNSKIKYYNCSDGAYLMGAEPLRAKDIILNNDIKKDIVLKSIDSEFKIFDNTSLVVIRDLYKKKKDYMISFIIDIKQDILKSGNINSFSKLFSLFHIISYKIYSLHYNKLANMGVSILRGTLLLMLSSIYTHALMSKDFEESMKFINNSLQTVIEFLDFVAKDIKISI